MHDIHIDTVTKWHSLTSSSNGVPELAYASPPLELPVHVLGCESAGVALATNAA